MSQDQRQLGLARLLLFFGGTAYLGWWLFVHIALPRAFNPFFSRAAVVACFLGVFAASFYVRSVAQRIDNWLATCCWLATAHYFYLFHENHLDMNWVIGSFITVIAICAILQTATSLLLYSIFVVALSIGLLSLERSLSSVVFLPGMATILAFANVGLRGRLKLLARLQESNQRFSGLFDAGFEGVVVHDREIIREANGAMAEMLGYAKGELIGKNVLDFIAPEARAAVAEKMATGFGDPYELDLLKKDGSRLTVEVAGKAHVLNGKPMQLVALRDLTDRKRAEKARVLYEATQQAVKIRDEFISVASHELKTPLTNIKLRTDMAKKSLLEGKEGIFEREWILRFIRQTDSQATRLAKLVEDMLDISRIAAGRLSMNVESVDLSAVARETAEGAADLLKLAKCELRLEIQDDVRVIADRVRMEQLIEGLLSNVAKYGRGQPATLSIQVRGNEAELTVQDHGLGVAKEDQNRIFEKFERAVSSRNISGLGLGLYICKQIVEAHHGRIEVESELGQGSLFRVLLPLVR